MPLLQADYYDGRSARAHRVTLTLEGGRLHVAGDGVSRDDGVAELRVSEPMGLAPRLIKFADGAHCQVMDHAGLAALLAQGGHQDGLVVRLQHRWPWALAAIVFTVGVFFAGYRWGLPAASEWLAYRVPESLLVRLGDGTLNALDQAMFAPSRLPPDRQARLAERFDRLAVSDGAKPAHRLVFRHSPRIGANALALPDGTIVMTDELVKLAGEDGEVVAVLAHELGHLDRRHSLRMLIQSSIVGLVVAWYLGDVSSVAAGLPTLLLEAGYSREHEREADDYAARLLAYNGLSPLLLADMLEKLEAAHREGAAKEDGEGLDYFSSHPATRERIDRLRRAAMTGGDPGGR